MARRRKDPTRHVHGEHQAAKIAESQQNRQIATRAVATAGLSRRAAACHAACARSPGCMPRPDVGGSRPEHARASTQVGIEAGGAGRPGGVDVGLQNHFWGRRSAARTPHSRVGGKLSEVELSLWRKVIAPRLQERSQHCGAGRLVGVDPAAQNHFWGFDRAARTSHSRMRVRSFELETSSWRKVIAVRRQERCERSSERFVTRAGVRGSHV